jgi:signal transduction histidine kinase/ActR/RegA family two-component response regulator
MYIPDVFQLPHGEVREILEPQSIKSLLAVPMCINGNCIGFVGFDSVRQHHQYSSADQQLLHVFAHVLANVKMRKEMINNLVIAMRKTEESEKKLKESQTIAKLGGWELDINKEVFTFNDNFYTLFHTDAKEMGGYEMTVDEYAKRFLVAEDSQLIANEMGKGLNTTKPDFSNYVEHRIRYYDGGTGYIAVKYFIVKDNYGNTIRAYGVNQDITEKKFLELDLIAAKEKAEESNRLKTAFINNISHEIRTPLNGILGFGGLMMDESLSFDEKSEFHNLLQQSTNRLLQTITDIIDISELNAGTILPQKVDVLASTLLNNQVEKIRKSCGLKKIELIVQIPVKYENLIVQTDEELIGKILSQLLSNAEKFTTTGSIQLGFEVFDNWIHFFVKDTGKGIASDKLEIVFEPFIQEDVFNTRGHEGNGLGLALCKGMVELLGGKIWVESQKGIGSTFFFKIPYENDEASFYLTIEDVTNTRIAAQKHLVLIAEDDELNFIYMKALLNRIDCINIHAYNGAEAVALCKQHPEISLVLMDIKMPVMNGIETTKQIREFRPELPIIATTAYAQTGDGQLCLQAGCNDYLPKPIQKEDLIKLLNKYLYRTQ